MSVVRPLARWRGGEGINICWSSRPQSALRGRNLVSPSPPLLFHVQEPSPSPYSWHVPSPPPPFCIIQVLFSHGAEAAARGGTVLLKGRRFPEAVKIARIINGHHMLPIFSELCVFCDVRKDMGEFLRPCALTLTCWFEREIRPPLL